MAKLLHIEASPRKERSASIEIANAFLDAYRSTNPKDGVEKIDLWSLNLPEFNDDVLSAKYAVLQGESQTAAQAAAWSRVVALVERFKSADKMLFSVPMWNFGIPYKLKHLVDVLTQPGLTFSYTPEEGFKGLVTRKKAAVIYARGGEYAVGTPWETYDLQRPYMELWLGFVGVTDVQSIVIEPTLSAPETVGRSKAGARELARRIAAAF